MTHDEINSPKHYKTGSDIECIDAIKAQLTDEEFKGYLKGNVIKYVWRENYKGGVVSLQKGEWYLAYLNKILLESQKSDN